MTQPATDPDHFLIIDLEATCWESREESAKNVSEIIEIGLVVLNTRTNQVDDQRSIIVRPERSKVSKFCTELTTLTQEDVDKGISFEEAYLILYNDYYSAVTPWASYGMYDKNMFIRNSDRYDWDTPMSDDHTNVKDLFTKKTGKKAPGMTGALAHFNIPLVGTHHRGLDDALNITKIYQALQKL